LTLDGDVAVSRARFSNNAVGGDRRYDISITLSGFRSLTQRGVTVLIGQRIHLTLTLQIGQISDSITVTAEAPMLNAASAEVSDIIDNHHVERLPLNGRQFLQLAQLGEGVVVPPGGTRGAALQQGGSLPAVDGQRSGHNIYLLDGVKVTDEYFNNLAVSPSPDAIQEFKIQKTMYPPEFGGKASALSNVVTRSGTNAYPRSRRTSGASSARSRPVRCRSAPGSPSRGVFAKAVTIPACGL
jgi:hypothetical protein